MACETPNQAPSANITSPTTGSIPNPVTVVATASDPAPGSGIREVRFSYRYCPLATGCGGEVSIGSDNSGPSPYTIVWAQPGCGAAPDSGFRIIARAVDNCGNVSGIAPVNVLATGRGCFRSDSVSAQAASWRSELQPAGARGQVVVDGATAVFPSAGKDSFATPLGAGSHRFEATLVQGAGRAGAGGSWRFDLQALRIAPGSLQVVAGDVVQLGADTVVFRLRGRAGERVVFAFELAEH